MRRNEKGIVAVIPALIVVVLLVIGFSLTSFKNGTFKDAQKRVLSENSSGGDSGSSGGGHGGETSSGGSSGGSSGSSSSGGSTSGNSAPSGGEVQVGTTIKTTTEVHNVETPEPAETPEAIETPHPETETEFEVEEGTEAAKTKITIKSNGEFSVKEAQFEAQSDFPLGINPKTNQLVASTSAGVKTVAILPDQAVQNMLATGAFSQVAPGQNNIQITTDANGNVIYEINGIKYEKLLGLFTVSIDKTGKVSAQNGQVLGVNQSLFSQLLDSISF